MDAVYAASEQHLQLFVQKRKQRISTVGETAFHLASSCCVFVQIGTACLVGQIDTAEVLLR